MRLCVSNFNMRLSKKCFEDTDYIIHWRRLRYDARKWVVLLWLAGSNFSLQHPSPSHSTGIIYNEKWISTTWWTLPFHLTWNWTMAYKPFIDISSKWCWTDWCGEGTSRCSSYKKWKHGGSRGFSYVERGTKIHTEADFWNYWSGKWNGVERVSSVLRLWQ